MSEEKENVNTIRADDGTTWVEIASCGTEDEANLLRGFLEAEEIPAQIENVKFSMEPINFGTMGDIRVYVPEDDRDHAEDDHLQVPGAPRRLGHHDDEGGAENRTGDAADAAHDRGDDEVDRVGEREELGADVADLEGEQTRAEPKQERRSRDLHDHLDLYSISIRRLSSLLLFMS